MIDKGVEGSFARGHSWFDAGRDFSSIDMTDVSQVSDSDSAEMPDADIDNGDEFEIEKIVNCKMVDGKVYYRIKWKGYAGEDCTWEAEENLERCYNFIIKYHEQIDGLTENRDIFKLSVNPDTEKVSLECRNHQTFPKTKFCSETKDLFTNKKKAFLEDDDLSDMSEFEDDDKKILSESSLSKDYSVSSIESVKNQPEGLTRLRKSNKKVRSKKSKKKEAAHENATKKGCYFFEGHVPQEILSHRIVGRGGGRTQLEVLIKWRKNIKSRERPKHCYYLADSLKMLAPEMLAEYYKKIFVRMLDDGKARKEQVAKVRMYSKSKKATQKEKPETAEKKKPEKISKKILVDYLGSKTQAKAARQQQLETMQLVQSMAPKHDFKVKPTRKEKNDKNPKKDKKDKKKKDSVDLTGFIDFGTLNPTKSNYFIDKRPEIIDEEEIFCE